MTSSKLLIRRLINKLLMGRFAVAYRFLKVHVTDDILDNKITYDPATDIGRALFYSGEFESKELELCRKYISKNSIVLDIGANIGLHSVFFSGLARQGCVVAFEPSLETFDLLIKNINGKANIVPMNIAISDAGGMLDFFQASDNAYSSLMDTRRKSIVKVTKVPCMKVDDVVLGLGLNHIDFVKIDVEGFESNVLKGMEQVITNHHPVIFCEIYKGVGSNQNPDKTVKFLIDKNYRAYVMRNDTLVGYEKHNDNFYNYLFLPIGGNYDLSYL